MSGAADAVDAGVDDTGGFPVSGLVLRWIAFIVAMVVVGYGLNALIDLGVVEGTPIVNVFIGIALSLAIIAVVVGVAFLVTATIRNVRRQRG